VSLNFDSLKSPKMLRIAIPVLLIIIVVVFFLIKLGVISADSTPATYTYTGTVKTLSGHAPAGVTPIAGSITLDYYYANTSCTGSSVAVPASQSVILESGKFTIIGLKVGCYSTRLGASVRTTTSIDQVSDKLNISVPAITQTASKNFNGATNKLGLVGVFSRSGSTISPTTTSTAVTYQVSGNLKDANGHIASGMSLSTGVKFYSNILANNPTRCDTVQKAIERKSATTDANGNFKLQGLGEGCYTITITPSTGGITYASSKGGNNDSVSITVNKNITTATTKATTGGGTITTTTSPFTPSSPVPTTPTVTPSPGTGNSVHLDGTVRLPNSHVPLSGKIDQGLVASNGAISWTNNVATIVSGAFKIDYSGVPADNGTKRTQTYMLRAHDVDGCNFASGSSDYTPVIPDPRTTPNTVTMSLTCTSMPTAGGIYGKVTFKGANQSGGKLDLYYKNPSTGKYGPDSIDTTQVYDPTVGYSFSVPKSGTYQIKASGYMGGCNGHPSALAATASSIVVTLGSNTPKNIILECTQ
jgi:hypothetical protein